MSYPIYQYFVRLFYTLSVFIYYSSASLEVSSILGVLVLLDTLLCALPTVHDPCGFLRFCPPCPGVSFLGRGTDSCPRDIRPDQRWGAVVDVEGVNKLRFRPDFGKIQVGGRNN